jgi:hypothetical protein
MNAALRPPIIAGMGVLRKGGRGLRQRVVILGLCLAAARALGKAPETVGFQPRGGFTICSVFQ